MSSSIFRSDDDAARLGIRIIHAQAFDICNSHERDKNRILQKEQMAKSTNGLLHMQQPVAALRLREALLQLQPPTASKMQICSNCAASPQSPSAAVTDDNVCVLKVACHAQNTSRECRLLLSKRGATHLHALLQSGAAARSRSRRCCRSHVIDNTGGVGCAQQ